MPTAKNLDISYQKQDTLQPKTRRTHPSEQFRVLHRLHLVHGREHRRSERHRRHIGAAVVPERERVLRAELARGAQVFEQRRADLSGKGRGQSPASVAVQSSGLSPLSSTAH